MSEHIKKCSQESERDRMRIGVVWKSLVWTLDLDRIVTCKLHRTSHDADKKFRKWILWWPALAPVCRASWQEMSHWNSNAIKAAWQICQALPLCPPKSHDSGIINHKATASKLLRLKASLSNYITRLLPVIIVTGPRNDCMQVPVGLWPSRMGSTMILSFYNYVLKSNVFRGILLKMQ